MTWLENALYLLAWPLLLIASLYAMALILKLLGLLFDRKVMK